MLGNYAVEASLPSLSLSSQGGGGGKGASLCVCVQTSQFLQGQESYWIKASLNEFVLASFTFAKMLFPKEGTFLGNQGLGFQDVYLGRAGTQFNPQQTPRDGGSP